MNNKFLNIIHIIKNNIIYIVIVSESILISMPFTIFGILVPIISVDLNLSASFMGLVLSVNSLGCFISVLIAGNIIELFGIKRVIVVSNICLILGMAMITFAQNDILFAFSYFITGFGSGGLGIALNFLISSVYKSQRSRRLLQFASFMFIGAILGSLLTISILYLEKSWRYCFTIIGILFFIILLIVIKTDLSKFVVKATFNIRAFLNAYKGIFLDKRFVIMGFIVFFHDGAIAIFMNWFTTYFKGLNVQVTTSSSILILYSLSEIAGLLLKAHLIKFWSESKLIIVKSVIALICFIGLIFTNNFLVKIFFIAGIGISSTGLFMLVSSLGVGLNNKNLGIVLGYIYSNAYIGSIFLLYISGLLIEQFSHTSVLYFCLFIWFLLNFFAFINIILEKKSSYK